MIADKYCVWIYEKRYGLLVKKYFVGSKEEAAEIHKKITKKGYRAVIEEDPPHWVQMQQA